MTIPQTFIQELVARADVVDIVGRFVQLKKGGANFTGLCPFHSEKSPSFSVSPSKQFYHCFGCGKNGNVISFLMDHGGMSFVEAVEDLAQQFGMQVPEDQASPEDRARAKEQRARQETLTSVLEKAGDAFRKQLKLSPKAVAYFKGRGVSGAIAKTFGLGYASEGWRGLASVFASYEDPLLVESGLVIHNEAEAENPASEEKRYDRFRDRVMFPIRNIKGECIGFGGRVLSDEKPKYLNSPETPVFSKGRELYGLFEARTAVREMGYALVTEGYMDVVALAQLGFANTVATLGTACTPDHVQKLFRFTDVVVFSFDGDAAGRKAARKALDAALPYASDIRNIKFLFLPTEHDPDSFIRAEGPQAFASMVSQATPLSRFLVEAASSECDLQTAEGRSRMASNAKPLWMQLPEGALKLQILAEIASMVELNSRELTDLWIPAAKQSPYKNTTQRKNTPHSSQLLHANSALRTGSFGLQGMQPRNRGLNTLRARPSSRADHAMRVLLTHAHLWDTLSTEEHALLCQLPMPHGALFHWLEAFQADNGPLPWSSLRAALAQDPAFSWLTQVMGEQSAALATDISSTKAAPIQTTTTAPPPATEAMGELRDILNRLLIEHLTEQESAAIANASTDPAALDRWRELHQRRTDLQKLAADATIVG